MDGEELNVNIAEEIPYPSFTLNKEEGKIIITYPDGTVQELEGFLFEGYFEDDIKVATDYTIKGNGTKAKPLSISELEKTGTYAPAKFLVDLTDSGNTMPDGHKLGKGTRIVTKEYFTPFGLLYNYHGIKKIEEELEETHSNWRVPSKKDWDDLLNAAELCEEDRNHDTCEINKGTGNWAGARAKSVTCWKDSDKKEGGLPVAGIDNLPIEGHGKFHVIPVGYGEGSRGALDYDKDFDLEGIRLISSFWTSTPTGSVCKSENPNVFTRTFSFDTRKVIQESSKPTSKLSLRLCRDFDYDSFDEYETILGSNVPCVLISNPDLKYYKVWTSINVGFSAPQYSGVSSEEWADLVSEEEIELKEVYYVNEWNGIKWLKKQMNPGDSIVIGDYDGDPTTSGDTYHEWRVYEHEDGTSELIDTVEALKEEFEKEFDEINEKIDTLSASTIDEINRATSAETFISGSVHTLSGKVIEEINRATSAETNLQKEIDSIDVKEVEPTSQNILKSYNVFVNNEKRGVTIDVPKDEKIHDISTGWSGSVIDEQTGEYTYQPETGDTEVLRVVYRKDDGLYHLSEIAIEDLVHENEFKDGLLVKGDHTVNVFIDPDTDKDESGNTLLVATTPYFEGGIWKGGLKLSGLNGSIKSLQDELDRTQEGAGLSGDGSYIQNTGATYISGETSLNNADIKLDTELARVEKARKDVTGQSGDTYVPNSSTTSRPLNYISEAKDLNDADIKLDEGIQKLDAETVKGVVVDGVSGTVNQNVVNVEISGTSIPIGEDYQTHIIPDNPESVPHPIHNSYSVLDAVKQLEINIMSGVSKQINDEVTRAQEAENLITNNLNTLSSYTSEQISRVNSAITIETNRAMLSESALTGEIQSERLRATDVESQLHLAIENEVSDRRTAISDEIINREQADSRLERMINEANASISGNTIKIDNEIIRAINAENTITNNLNTLSNSVLVLSSSTSEAIDDINQRISTLDSRTVTGKEAINVLFSGNTSTVSLILNGFDKVLEQDSSGLRTTISLSIAPDGKTVYLRGKNNEIISQVDSSLFVKDGMLDNVTFDSTTKKLVFTFNNDAQKQQIEVPLGELVTIYTVSGGSEDYLSISDYQIGVKVDKPNGLASYNSVDNLRDDAESSANTINLALNSLSGSTTGLSATTKTIETNLNTLSGSTHMLEYKAENSASTLNEKIDDEEARAIAKETYLENLINTKANISGKNSIATERVGDTTVISLSFNSSDKVLTENADGLKTNISLQYSKDDKKLYLKGKPEGSGNATISEVEINDFTDFKISALTPSEIEELPEHENIREAYKLLNSTGVKLGDVIKIYKDSSLINAVLGHIGDLLVGTTAITEESNYPDINFTPATGASEALDFVYQLKNGKYKLAQVNLENFLQESEFKDGLVVNSNHEVRVKIDESGENFLSVSADGVKISGVTYAIESAVTIVNNTINQLSGSVSALTERVEALETAINNLSDTFYTMLKTTLSFTADEILISPDDGTKTITISFNSPYIIGKHGNGDDHDDF